MKRDLPAPLLLELDERNLAQFLSALALADLAKRGDGKDSFAQTCWWNEDGLFALKGELSHDQLRRELFAAAHIFLRSIRWCAGLGGAEIGSFVANTEIGANPFVSLSPNSNQRAPLKAFSARVTPAKNVKDQLDTLKAPSKETNWLEHRATGAGSWGLDCRTNAHANDAGISSDAEGTAEFDPIFPAIELLSIAATAFFVPVHSWQVSEGKLQYAAWTQPIALDSVSLAAGGRIIGLPSRRYSISTRGAAYGKGGAYKFFPEAIPE